MRFPKTKKGDLAKHFRVESVSSAELAWVAVGADA